jgi:hypothetical protein
VSTFQTLKVGNTVIDSWYGSGKVIKKTKRNCVIKLALQDEPWRYDREHVNKFITKRIRR